MGARETSANRKKLRHVVLAPSLRGATTTDSVVMHGDRALYTRAPVLHTQGPRRRGKSTLRHHKSTTSRRVCTRRDDHDSLLSTRRQCAAYKGPHAQGHKNASTTRTGEHDDDYDYDYDIGDAFNCPCCASKQRNENGLADSIEFK